jgi:dTDP-glucose 4,6-dehydratase
MVTGGAGFIGSHFVESLLTDSTIQVESLVVLDSLSYAGNLDNLANVQKDPRFKFVKGDIRDRIVTDQVIAGADFVFNFAAESHVDRSIKSSKEFVSTNILGTTNLLESSLINSKTIFIQISTDEVYGSITSNFSKEFDVLLPNSPYSASKASADLICRAFAQTHDLDIRITRSCNNFGIRQNEEKFIPKIISNMKRNEPIPIYGNGSNIREWISVFDNCSAIKKVAFQGRKGEIYNIGSGELLTNLEVVALLQHAFPYTKSKVEFISDRKGHDYRYALDSSKIREELNFKCNFTLADSLANLIN